MRTTAILAVGRMKFNTPNRGDQLAAPRELKGWLTDPDDCTVPAGAEVMNSGG